MKMTPGRPECPLRQSGRPCAVQSRTLARRARHARRDRVGTRSRTRGTPARISAQGWSPPPQSGRSFPPVPRSRAVVVGQDNGARTKVTFPAPSLKFRTSGFPGSGFKHQAPPQEIGAASSATCATLKADPAMPVAISRVCAALRLGSATLQVGWHHRPAASSESRHDLPTSPPGPGDPRSGRVVLSRPSPLDRPHPPVRRTPRHFPHTRLWARSLTFEGRNILSVLLAFRTFAAELSGIAAVPAPGDPTRARLGSFAPVPAIGQSGDPWHFPMSPQVGFHAGCLFSPLQTIVRFRCGPPGCSPPCPTGPEGQRPSSPRRLLRPCFRTPGRPGHPQGNDCGAKPGIAPTRLPPQVQQPVSLHSPRPASASLPAGTGAPGMPRCECGRPGISG